MTHPLFSVEYNESLKDTLHKEIDDLFASPNPNPARRVMGMMAFLCGVLQALAEKLPEEPQWLELAIKLNKIGSDILDKHDARRAPPSSLHH